MNITTWFHQQLSTYFSLTINLKISSFLGMQIDHDVPNKIITISQPGYINTILQRFNITKEVSKHALHIPFSQYDLTDNNPSSLSKQDQSLYMQIIGSLLFLSTRSRPDISFHVNYLSLFMKSATEHQLKLAKRILAYIFHTQDIHLQFHGQAGLNFLLMLIRLTHLTLTGNHNLGSRFILMTLLVRAYQFQKKRNYWLYLPLKQSIWLYLKHRKRSCGYVNF